MEPKAKAQPLKANQSVKKNYLYNLAYQLFALMIPLITTPYISRILGSGGIGQYSFSYSVMTYFTLLAGLGFGYYGQREVAACQQDPQAQSEIFWEIVIVRFVSVLAALILYGVVLFTGVYGSQYTVLMEILSINVLSVGLDVTFFFQGNEQFGLIALRNGLIKCLGAALIFMFVKTEQDVWVYTLCQSAAVLFSALSLWPALKGKLVNVSWKQLHFQRHLVPAFRLFVPTVAVSVYTMLDKTLIGVLVPGTVVTPNGTESLADLENGYYEQSEKIVKMVMMIVTSLGTVMIPRNSQSVASGNLKEFIQNVKGALHFVFILGMPLMFGLAAIALNFSPWFFGEGYDSVPYLIMMFCPLIVCIGLSNVLGLQYLIPLKKDSQYTRSITLGAGVNLVLNLFLIPAFASFGACAATLAAEGCVSGMMFYYARNQLSFWKQVRQDWKCIAAAALMGLLLFFWQRSLSASVAHTLLLMVSGLVLYVLFLALLQEKSLKKFLAKTESRLGWDHPKEPKSKKEC